MKCISSVMCVAVMALFSEGQGLTVAQPQSVVRDEIMLGSKKCPTFHPMTVKRDGFTKTPS